MDLIRTEKELRGLISLVERWSEQGYTPLVERDIALQRLRIVYEQLLGIEPCDRCENVPVEEPQNEPIPEQTHEQEPENEAVEGEDYKEEDEDESPLDNDDDDSNDDIEPQTNAELDDDEQDEQDEREQRERREQNEQQAQQEQQEQREKQEQQAQHDAMVQLMATEQRRRFVHDLFCNDETFYQNEMHKIEALATLDEVLIYIGKKYAWPADSTVAEEFVAKIAGKF